MSHPDTNEIIHEDFGWDGKCFYTEPAKDQDTIDFVRMLRSENAYLKGKIAVYEKFLKAKGYIKEEE